ncbi:unnamed protein product [Leuciscus chuanchicus]
MEEERDATLHSSDGCMEEERDATLHSSDGSMEEERDATLHSSDGCVEEERDATLHSSDGCMEEERYATLHTSDGCVEEERDATLHSSDGCVEEERDATLHSSDGCMEEERYAILHTSDGWIEEERYLEGEAEPEEELFDQTSETEDNTEFDPDYHSTDGEEEEEQEQEEDPPEADAAYQSKNGNILWTSTTHSERRGRIPTHRVIKMTPGPTKFACSNAKDIISTFELFFPNNIKKILIEMSNLEGKRVFGKAWKSLDWTDIQAYFGLLILAGVYRSHHEALSSLWGSVSGRAIFRATMPLKTFSIMSRIFCFYRKDAGSGRKKDDKLAPIRDIWEKWVQRLPLLYNPGPSVTVDECLVPFRGRCPFKQYMPSKPSKYGIKIWAACDASSSYAWNMQIYTGKAADRKPEKNQGMRVVLDMTSGLQGHTITCDNFFTSYALGKELLQRKMTMIGTVRLNKPELPPALLSVKNRARFSSKFAFTETHALVSYCPRKNKNVLLMSTLHRDAAISSKDHKKPEIILDYNKTKGGVDTLDQLVGTYTCQRKTMRWPMVIFFNMLDVSAYNSLVLWTEMDPMWNKQKCFKRRLFLEELGEALVTPFMIRRQGIPRTPASQNMIKEAQAFSQVNEASPGKALYHKVMEARACSVKVQKNSPSPVSTPSKRKRCQGLRTLAVL